MGVGHLFCNLRVQMIYVKKIVNKPVNSNTYILSNIQSPYCLIIDPGSIDISEIICYINKIGKIPSAILLTHEHFDHIYGVNKLFNFNCDISIYASQKTLERIQDRRKNLSLYFDQIGFEILNSNFIVIKTEEIKIDIFNIRILKTIGHTDSSLSFLIDGKLFTGDFN